MPRRGRLPRRRSDTGEGSEGREREGRGRGSEAQKPERKRGRGEGDEGEGKKGSRSSPLFNFDRVDEHGMEWKRRSRQGEMMAL
ncbi:hypothetical protein PAMA_013195 [Pampus argenteus]